MSQRKIIVNSKGFPVQPENIDASKHFFDAFDNAETEVSAGWIIRYLQEREEGWAPFTYEEIDAFYARKYQHGFRFNRLVDPEMIPPSLVRAFAGHIDPLIPAGVAGLSFAMIKSIE